MQSKLIGSGITLALTLALILATYGAPTSAAQIYKTVDKDGNVVFTDVPPSDKAGTVKLEEYNRYQPIAPASNTPTASTEANVEEAEDEAPETVYELISIATPIDDQAIRQNNGMVTVAVNTTPALDTAAGHKVRVLLDGVMMAEGSDASVLLENVDRGTHQLSAQITDANGEVLAQSASTTFHLLRHSILTAPNRPSSQ